MAHSKSIGDRCAWIRDHSEFQSCRQYLLSLSVATRLNREHCAFIVVILVVALAMILLDIATLHEATVTSHDAVNILQFRTTAQACQLENLELPENKRNLKSQSGEDVVLLQWFNGLCQGTYFEMGALDGVRFSNSFFFNQVLKWQGLLVEVSPASYKELAVNRPNELARVHAAVCNGDHQVLHHYAPGEMAVAGIWEFTTESFREQWWPGVKLEDTTPVECRTLKNIMSTELPATPGGNHFFDFGSLDCEGCEWTALQSIDWQHTAFGVFVVEADDHNHRKNLSIRTFLQSKGYIYMKIAEQRNDWFVHPNFHSIYSDLIHTT